MEVSGAGGIVFPESYIMQIQSFANKSAAPGAARHTSNRPSDDDDDAWSSLADTLEIESHDLGTTEATKEVSNDAFASPAAIKNEFAAAKKRLRERQTVLDAQQRQLANRPNPVNLQHLQGHHNPYGTYGGNTAYGSTPQTYGTGYHSRTWNNAYPTPPVAANPPAVINAADGVNSFSVSAGYDPNAVAANGMPVPLDPATGLPVQLDSWGNPILPAGAQVDEYNNIVYR
jgi:hypothetical protein